MGAIWRAWRQPEAERLAGCGAGVRDSNGLGDLRILEGGTLITNAVQTRH